MMKKICIGLTALSLAAVCGSAHAGEATQMSSAHLTLKTAQPYNVAYKVDRQVVPKRRIVRIVKTDAPRARMINGYYQLPATQQTTRRRIVAKPVKPMPNLYASVTGANTPVLFDKAALQAR